MASGAGCFLLRLSRRCVASLCLGLLVTVSAATAQTTAGNNAVTDLQEPVEIGTLGVVQNGDNPAYALPDFDDSKWPAVDAKTRLAEYFPVNQSPVIWRRIHIKVAPGQKHVAIEAYSISRAFEVYVNGEKLIQSGQVEPYQPTMRLARLIASIPEAQLQTGSLVIAVRARAPLTWWTSVVPAFNGPMLKLGDESALHNQNMLSMVGENTFPFLESLLALGVGLVALALYINQRERKEYFWIFILGIVSAAELPLDYLAAIRNVPVSLWIIEEALILASLIATAIMVQAFLRKPFGRVLWLCIVLACVGTSVCDIGYEYGAYPISYDTLFTIGVGIIYAALIPFLIFRQYRRGDREAGILLIPFLLYSLWIYAQIFTGFLTLIPQLRTFVAEANQAINAFPLGIFTVGLVDLGNLSFNFSLAIIIVLRSVRMSREQAVLEGEMAAAREVQQVILPEQVESVPGFAIESVYQPAQQVGGDFFQVLPDSNGGLLLVLGDVAGKGLPAAMLVSVLVGAIRTAAAYSQSPAEVLAQLNERLVGRTRDAFSTALAAHIAADGQVTIANAGHLSPYLDGREVELPGALPLGIIKNAAYVATRLQLAPGSRLTFYSDGVVEAQKPNGELFGFDRVRSLSTQPAAEIAYAASQFGQADDITVVAITRADAVANAA